MDKEPFKDSLEYRLWRKSAVFLTMFLLFLSACMAGVEWNLPLPMKHSALFTMAICLAPMLCVAVFASYIGSKRLYQKRMSGWTPLDAMNPKGHFLASAIFKFIDKIRGIR